MASHIWIGGAPAIAQIDLVTVPADVEAGQIVNLVIGNKTLPVTLAGTTQVAVVAELVSAWNASNIPEFAEITAAAGSTAGTITLTSDTAGKPFAVTVSIGSGSNEVQVVTLGGTAATGGTFMLTFNGETTTTIAYNADAATVQSALEGLASYTSGDFAVTGSAGGPWTVAFTGTLAGTNVSLMTIDVSSLTGGVNEVQTISSPSNPTGGTFTLSFNGQTTAAIAYNANAAAVETALEGLSNIPTGSVSCGGGSLPGTPVTVTFQDELAATDVALLVANSSNLTGITGSAAETTPGGSAVQRSALNYFAFGDASSTTDAQKYGDLTGSGVQLDLTGTDWSRVAGGKIDYGIYTAGSSVPIEEADIANFGQGEDFSVSFWFKTSSVGIGGAIIMASGTDTTYQWYVAVGASDNMTFWRKGTTNEEVSSSGTITANTWHHVVCVWDWTNKFIRISLDGAAFDSAAIADTTALSKATGTSLRIGETIDLGGIFAGTSTNEYTGFLDSIGIYNDALTITEAQDTYNSGSGDDYPFPATSANEVQTLTLTGSPTAGSVLVSYQGVGVEVPYDATAAEAEVLIESISTIGTGNVNVTGGDWPGTALVVEFINDLALVDVELLDIDTSTLVMTVAETTKGVTAPTGSVVTTVTPLTQSTTTANEGPNNWDVAANWNSNTVPVSSDTVYISDSNTGILYGLDQSAVTLAALYVEQTFTGAIGLPRLNSDGATSYSEYRDQYLKIGATLLNIGDKQGDGSERIKINLGSVQSTVLITNSGDSPDGNTPAILLLGTHASNTININRGSLGVAYYPTELATVATLRQAFFDNAADDTTVYLGSGVTMTDIVKSGGILDINSATTTFKQTAGTTTIHAGAHAVLNILAGLVNYNSTGTLSAVNLSGDGVLVFDQDARPKDVTIINKYTDDSEIYDESGSIASPVIDLENCGDLSTLHMGQDFKLTFGATT